MSNLPAPQNTDSLPADAPRGRDAERLLWAQLLAEFRDYSQRNTEFIGRLVGNLVNNTLEVGSGVFDSSGLITRTFHAPIGHVVLDNQSQHVVQVKTGQNTGLSPTVAAGNNIGVYPVPPGAIRPVAIDDHSVTFYGTPGDLIAWQVFTTPARPAAGIGAVIGGGA